MTQLQHQNTQIYRKVLTFGLLLLCAICSSNIAKATEFGEIRYSKDAFIDYTKIDKSKTLSLADFYFDKALSANNKEEKQAYLEKASGEYFILTQAEPKKLYPIVQLARVYDFEGQNSFAKAYFFKALKIDKSNAETNYYFGDFYYSRNDYKRALYYYNKAFENGYEANFSVLIKMAVMYEKLGDLEKANRYYKRAFIAKPNSQALPDKIIELEDLQYKNTGYYNKQRRK
jgi:tetratricopeptide (TPR) repeat protein